VVVTLKSAPSWSSIPPPAQAEIAMASLPATASLLPLTILLGLIAPGGAMKTDSPHNSRNLGESPAR
jgi:hypothetical protein